MTWLSSLGDDDILVAYALEDSPEAVLQVVSVDGRTGHINWRYDPDGVVFAYPLARDVVAVYRYQPSSDRYVMSILSAADGEERWTVREMPGPSATRPCTSVVTAGSSRTTSSPGPSAGAGA